MIIRSYQTVRNRFYDRNVRAGSIFPVLAKYDRAFLDWLAEQTHNGEVTLIEVLASTAYDAYLDEVQQDEKPAKVA